MTRKTKGCLIALGTLAGLAVLALGIAILSLPAYRQHVRRVWKDNALQEIRQFADDPAQVENEIKRFKDGNASWLTERMILMADGEWVAYKQKCSKEDWRIDDIFLAKGSNGKWYYSTCHFCVRMCAFRMCQEQQPGDLVTFARNWRLEEFDGKSDDCLRKTQFDCDLKAIDAAAGAVSYDAAPVGPGPRR